PSLDRHRAILPSLRIANRDSLTQVVLVPLPLAAANCCNPKNSTFSDGIVGPKLALPRLRTSCVQAAVLDVSRPAHSSNDCLGRSLCPAIDRYRAYPARETGKWRASSVVGTGATTSAVRSSGTSLMGVGNQYPPFNSWASRIKVRTLSAYLNAC